MQLVPLLVTVFLIAFIVGHADSFVRPLPYISGRPWDFPGIGLIAIIVIFYLVGLLISTAVGRRIMGGKARCSVISRYQDHIRSHRADDHADGVRLSFSAAWCSWSGPEREWWPWDS